MLALALSASYFFSFRCQQPEQRVLSVILMALRVTLGALFIYALLDQFHLLP